MEQKNYWPSSKYIFDSCSNTLVCRRNHWDILKSIFSENLTTYNSYNFRRVMENLLKCSWWPGHFLSKQDYHWISWVIHYLLLRFYHQRYVSRNSSQNIQLEAIYNHIFLRYYVSVDNPTWEPHIFLVKMKV